MSVSELFTLGAIRINGASATISGGLSHDFDPGIEDRSEITDGLIHPTQISAFQARPVYRFATMDVAAAISNLGIWGYIVSSASADFYLRKVVELGTRSTGNDHTKISMNRGLIIGMELRAEQGAEAQISYEAHGEYYNLTNPFSISNSQGIVAVAAPSPYTLGPVSINGSALTGVQSISVMPNIRLFKVQGDGDIFPSYVAIQTRTPVITIRTTMATAVATFGITGAAQNPVTPSILYLRKKYPGLGTCADNTNSHIKMMVYAGKINANRVSASGTDQADCEITIKPIDDGINDMIVFGVNQQIA